MNNIPIETVKTQLGGMVLQILGLQAQVAALTAENEQLKKPAEKKPRV